MLNYLEKFNNLPQDLRDKISSEKVMKAISDIEKKYGITLAMVIMRVMVKDISILDLAKYFVFEHDMDGRTAEKMVDELKEKVFADVADYLGFELDKDVISIEELESGEDIKKQEKSEEKNNSSEVSVLEKESEKFDDKFNDKNNQDGDEDWIREREKEIKARGSSFFFSPEDEEEVQELTKKLEEFKVDKKAKIESKKEIEEKIKKQIADVRKQLNIHFSSEELSKRFDNILTTYLRGVRNKIDTKQTLIKKVEIGGLGMTQVFADNVLLLVDSGKNNTASKTNTDKKEKEEENLNKNNSSLSKEKEPDKKQEKVEKKPDFANLDTRDAYYDFNNMSPEAKKQKEKIKEKSKKEELVPKTKDEYSKEFSDNNSKNDNSELDQKNKGKINISANIASSDPLKKKVVDVKAPKLLGPIDELREMTLTDFRRLGESPLQIIKKIQEKFDFLEEDGYAKRLEGIKAWRESPVNKMYLKIGQESIMQKKPINVIISEMEETEKESLSEDEFKAIMDLNRNIRF